MRKKPEIRKVQVQKIKEEPKNIAHKRDWPLLVLILTAFLLYVNTIGNHYALDDSIVITQNQFTVKGWEGIGKIFTTDSFTGFFGVQKNLVSGGRYRPLSIATFALEHQFFGSNPHISHGINVLLFLITIWLLFVILKKIIPFKNHESIWISLPFIATLWFVVHPIHTEVIANIKGRDEILSLSGGLFALWLSIKYVEKPNFKILILSGLLLFLGLMSKENCISFVAIIPITLWFFNKGNLKTIIITLIPLLLASMIFLIIRRSVLGPQSGQIANELMNNPFLHATEGQKFATIFFTFFLYFKLLIWPYPLTYDYYPKQIPLVEFSYWGTILGILITLLVVFLAIQGIKKCGIASWALIFFMATFVLVSNLLFPIGTFMNERFMYVPSIGFCVLAAWLLFDKIPETFKKVKMIYIQGFIFAVFLIYSIMTIARNPVWNNDLTLFTTDVKTSVNSAKGNCTAGGKLWEAAITKKDKFSRDSLMQLSLKYLNRSLEIYPEYVDALLLRGNVLWDYKMDYTHAVQDYFKILKMSPQHKNATDNLQIVVSKSGNVDFQIASYERLLTINPKLYNPNYQLGLLYGREKGNLEKAGQMFERAIQLEPNHVEVYKDLGVVYGLKKDYLKAEKILIKAAELDPNDEQTLYNLGVTYSALKMVDQAKKYMDRAEMIKNKKGGK